MNEKPLRRLHYYNGQRLEAADLKEEQEYHIRTRRWLNKSLYSAGIARGLEVIKFPDGTPNVIVTSGLALDYEGREIILLEEIQLEVRATSGTTQNSPNGNYLVVEYIEESIAYESGSCAMRTTESKTSKPSSNWGGPARIQSHVKFSWVRFVPPPETKQVVLAWVELDASCSKIIQIDPGIRHYIGRASEALVKQYVLEGERVIANVCSMAQAETFIPTTAKVYFHIRGRTPNSITLYLKASEFPKIHYTEMGQHSHSSNTTGASTVTAPATSVDAHTHNHNLTTLQDRHTHRIVGQLDEPVNEPRNLTKEPPGYYSIHPGVRIDGPGYSEMQYFDEFLGMKTYFENVIEGEVGGHNHGVTGGITETVQPATGTGLHTHTIDGQLTTTVDNSGVLDQSANKSYSARNRAPLTYFDDLKIAIDGTDRTVEILEQIINTVGGQAQAWGSKLGNGKSDHPLVDEGVDAVPIRLDYLPRPPSSEGQHVIEFSLPNSEANGGKIHYNLYIE